MFYMCLHRQFKCFKHFARCALWFETIHHKKAKSNRPQVSTVYRHDKPLEKLPDCVSELFVRKGSAHSLRNSDFVLPRFETIRYGKHSVRYLGPFLWSKLNENQRDSPSLRIFINEIRKLNLDEIVINNSNCCNLCSQ